MIFIQRKNITVKVDYTRYLDWTLTDLSANTSLFVEPDEYAMAYFVGLTTYKDNTPMYVPAVWEERNNRRWEVQYDDQIRLIMTNRNTATTSYDMHVGGIMEFYLCV
jgi:hypothetical protein